MKEGGFERILSSVKDDLRNCVGSYFSPVRAVVQDIRRSVQGKTQAAPFGEAMSRGLSPMADPDQTATTDPPTIGQVLTMIEGMSCQHIRFTLATLVVSGVVEPALFERAFKIGAPDAAHG